MDDLHAFKAKCDDIVTGLIEGATREETMEILLAHVLSHLENPFESSRVGAVSSVSSAARADVAGAYEAAAQALDRYWTGVGTRTAPDLRALTPADAKAALDAMLAKAHEEGRAEGRASRV